MQPIRRWRTSSLFALFVALLVLSGFAISAIPSEEKATDADVMEACAHGCVLVPRPMWEDIKSELAACDGRQRL